MSYGYWNGGGRGTYRKSDGSWAKPSEARPQEKPEALPLPEVAEQLEAVTYRGFKRDGTPLSVESRLSLHDAVRVCETLPNVFARNIAEKAKDRDPSASQTFWLHFLANEALDRAKPKTADAKMQAKGFRKLLDMFAAAVKSGLTRPRWVFAAKNEGDKTIIMVLQAPTREDGTPSQYAGSVWVNGERSDEGRPRYGRITPEGEYFKGKDADDAVLAFMTKFAKNPAKVAAEHGKATGSCCFCNQKLTDARSREVGYGPVCAERYELPWG